MSTVQTPVNTVCEFDGGELDGTHGTPTTVDDEIVISSSSKPLKPIPGIKAIFTDLDGTFWMPWLPEDHCPGSTTREIEENFKCVEALQAEGIEVVLATGRGRTGVVNEALFRGISPELFPIVRASGVYVDGSVVLAGAEDKPCHIEQFPRSLIADVWTIAADLDGYFHWWCHDEVIGIAGRNGFDNKLFLKQRCSTRLVNRNTFNQDIGNENVLAIWLTGHSPEHCRNLYHACIAAANLRELRIVYYSTSGWTVLMSKKADKLRGLHHIMQARGWKPEEVLVVGDGVNDIEMLEGMPNSIAMINGVDSAKEAAKMISEVCCEEGGWAHTMRKVLLGKQAL